MNLQILRLAAIIFTAVVLGNCSAPVSVQSRPLLKPARVSERHQQLNSLVDELRHAAGQLDRHVPASVTTYNERLSRLLEAITLAGDEISNNHLTLNTATGIRSLKIVAPDGFLPPTADLLPVDTLKFRGDYADHKAIVPGLGAPLVAVKSTDQIGHTELRKNQPLRNLTAIIRFSGDQATIDLTDPYQTESLSYGGQRYPLAADFSGAVMYGLSTARIDKLGLARLLAPQKYADTAILNFLQPYDPDRIPVLMVHGLDSTPATWAPAYFDLLEDEEIRKRYQFWVFSYPSGYPYPYSASLLRKELAHVHHDFPDHKDMVIVGHSMGSMITRIMITDVGDKLWVSAFGTTPENTEIGGKSRQLLEDAAIFNHDPTISRAIMVSGPHRGSEGADNPIVKLLNRLVKLPGFMADVRDAASAAVTADSSAFALNRAPSSFDTLSPENPFVKEINKYPIHPSIPFHSLMGDRGKGDTPDSSDGIVAYWSSHLDGARSNKIVPSGHSAHHHPVGIEEIRRILHLHLKEVR